MTLKKRFDKEDKKINKIKVEYNNALLRYNNIINMMTNNFIAAAFRFKQGVYFINKK